MMRMMRKGTRASGRPARARRSAAAAVGRPTLAMLLLVAGLLLASAFVSIEIQRNALGREAAAYRAELAAAEAAHAQLAADVATKKTDDYVTNRARDYGYVLPGEALIGVQRDAASPATAASAPVPSHAQKWIALFFGSR